MRLPGPLQLRPNGLLASLGALLIAVACAGTAGQSPGASTNVPGQLPTPAASGVPGSSATGSGAIAVVVGPSGWEVPMVGDCHLTLAPVDPEAPPPDIGPGTLPSLEGSTLVLTLSQATTDQPSTLPSLSPLPSPNSGPDASAGPSGAPPLVPPTPVAASTLQLTSVLTRTSTTPGESPAPTASPEASPGASGEPTNSGTSLLPYSVLGGNAQLTIFLPQQFIFEATMTGGAVAPDARSGYLALDPGTGELVLVHFLCETITISSAPEEAASPSPGESPSGSPAAESPGASSSPAAP
jgi:hypothetical protein